MRRSLVLMTALIVGALRPNFVFAQQGLDQASIQKVVDEICSDNGEWLKCYSLDSANCQSITSGFVEPCVRKVMREGPGDKAGGDVTSLLLCFNREFMAKYGFGEVKTPECKNPMKHLSAK